jgi:hypothetical protein
MAREVVRIGVSVHLEPAVDDPDVRVLQACGNAFGGPEEAGTGEWAHPDNLAVLRVTLYERAGCHLCEEVGDALGRIGRVAIERVDIAADPELERRFLVRIPVLAMDGRELDAAGLGQQEIAAWLDV